MAITLENAGPCKKRIKVSLGPEAVKPEIDEHLAEAMAHAQLPGFRKGKVPREMVERRFGAKIAEEARDHLIAHSYQDALKEHKLEPVAEPVLEKVEFDPAKGLTYEATLEVAPEFDLPSLSNLPLKRKEVQVTDADLDAASKDFRKQRAEWVPAPAGAALKSGDLAVTDLSLKEGEKEAWSRKDFGILLGEAPLGELPTGPTDKLLEGCRAGETRTTVLTLPADFAREDLRGKMVTLLLSVREVRHERLPDLDDAYAKGMGLKDAAELRERLREHVRSHKEADAHRQLEEDLLSHLIQKTKFDLPQDLLAAQAQGAMRQSAVDLLMRGIPEEEVKKNIDKLQAGSKEWAERRLRTAFILTRIAEKEKILVTESDVEDRIRTLAAQRGERPDDLKSRLHKEGTLGSVRSSIREAKVIDLLLSRTAGAAKA